MEKEVVRCRYCRHFLWPERICEKGYGRGRGNDDDDGCTFGKHITNSIKQEINECFKRVRDYIEAYKPLHYNE